jgi:hypothetical protein
MMGMRTEPPLSQQCKGIFESCCSPTRLIEIIGQEFNHQPLVRMPSSLSPKSQNESDFAECEIEERTLGGITILSSHILVARNHLKVAFLQECGF